MRRLRVCHLSKYYPPAPGGIETHVRTLALAQAGRGAEVRVFCVNHEGATTTVERDGPVEVVRFGRVAEVAKLDLCPGLATALARVDADLLHLHPAPAHRAEAGAIRARHRGPIWLGCGRQVYYKGFGNAIRALAHVPGTLLLSGDGPDGPALRAEASAAGLADRVVFLGNLP